MDQLIVRVLTEEVQRRHCPGCGGSLRRADVSARFSAVDKVALRFRCHFCVFEGGGEIELTPEIYREAAQTADPSGPARGPAGPAPAGGGPPPGEPKDPISGDELIAVHEILAGWGAGLAELLATAPR